MSLGQIIAAALAAGVSFRLSQWATEETGNFLRTALIFVVNRHTIDLRKHRLFCPDCAHECQTVACDHCGAHYSPKELAGRPTDG